MSELIVLGSSNAIPSHGHENTHLVFFSAKRTVLIDCGSNPVVRMQQAGRDGNDITDIIITHMHPDHVAGLPLLLMDLWLMGREQPLLIHGLDYTIDRIEKMLELYSWNDWPNFFPLKFNTILAEEMSTVLSDEHVSILASPVKHFLPNICLRIDLKNEKKSVVYSCDTEPCQSILNISIGADVLLHEASGLHCGHSSAAQAGEIASQAGVGALYLIHYPTGQYQTGDLLEEAKSEFSGPVFLAKDLMSIDLN